MEFNELLWQFVIMWEEQDFVGMCFSNPPVALVITFESRDHEGYGRIAEAHPYGVTSLRHLSNCHTILFMSIIGPYWYFACFVLEGIVREPTRADC